MSARDDYPWQITRVCAWSLGHRDRHQCDCVCVRPKGHDGAHQCAVQVVEP